MATQRELEMRRLLALRAERGWTMRKVADLAGISVRTARWWAWRLRNSGPRNAEEAPAFVELLPAAEDSDERRGCWRVVVREGVVVEVPATVPVEEIAEFVRALVSRC